MMVASLKKMLGERTERVRSVLLQWWSVLRSQPRHVHLRGLAALISVYIGWFTYDVLASVPDREGLRALHTMAQASVILDASDRPVFTLAREHRIEVPLAEISPHLVRAVVAIEDRRFFEHEGFDPVRIVGSALAVLRAGKAVQGGSTITQQLARQSLGREKTLRRKLKELLIAIQIERHFTKRQILELYLNKVYFGDGLYGVEAAARGFFGKHSSELTIAESALLAGLLKAPSTYAPTVNAEKAIARRAIVLQALVETGAITAAERDRADREDLRLRDGLRRDEPHGLYFKEDVRRQLVDRFGWERVSEGGLRVFTSFDLAMQRAAEAAVQQSLRDIERPGSAERLQAALIALDARTGAVRAIVGGRDFDQSSYNRATQARRQPGSAFKPFVYAAALEAGYRPNDVIDRLDEPVRSGRKEWMPEDEHSTASSLTLREALRTSSNRAAVRLLDEIGLERTLDTARGFGFEDLPPVPSVALGSGEVTLDRLTAAFGAFANGGLYRRPMMFRRVVDRNGNVLFEAEEPPVRTVSLLTAYWMVNMLAEVVDAGTGEGVRRMGYQLPAGGKTGTTNNFRDAWFIGFTPGVVAGVWLGFDQPRTIKAQGYASTLAVPLWTRFMAVATRRDPPQWFEPPPGEDGVALVDADGNRTRKKRGFWARVFGVGDGDVYASEPPERDDSRRGRDRKRRR